MIYAQREDFSPRFNKFIARNVDVMKKNKKHKKMAALSDWAKNTKYDCFQICHQFTQNVKRLQEITKQKQLPAS